MNKNIFIEYGNNKKYILHILDINNNDILSIIMENLNDIINCDKQFVLLNNGKIHIILHNKNNIKSNSNINFHLRNTINEINKYLQYHNYGNASFKINDFDEKKKINYIRGIYEQ